MARRAELLDWADRNEAWIIEDDYDNEFRFSGRALPPIHALDGGERVIYVGTFSKVLFPSLRLGFAVVPEWLVDAFVAARAVVGRYSPLLDQVLVAEFMLEGHYASHLARMRKVYSERQAFMLECAASELAGFATLEPTETGMQLLATVADDFDPDSVAVAAHERGLEIYPVSWFAVEQHSPAALLMGFSAFSPKQIESGLQALRTCFEIQHRRRPVG
jgi:GntR family transcriptional regulator / MocR family aminotransferase